mmetsp:Transcript_30724/g.53910  ORF Transcript_30724/g.53910 Transcript_30724/m.53910 type:complete len:213 (-) Transcript_30724:141-779(-)
MRVFSTLASPWHTAFFSSSKVELESTTGESKMNGRFRFFPWFLPLPTCCESCIICSPFVFLNTLPLISGGLVLTEGEIASDIGSDPSNSADASASSRTLPTLSTAESGPTRYFPMLFSFGFGFSGGCLTAGCLTAAGTTAAAAAATAGATATFRTGTAAAATVAGAADVAATEGLGATEAAGSGWWRWIVAIGGLCFFGRDGGMGLAFWTWW